MRKKIFLLLLIAVTVFFLYWHAPSQQTISPFARYATIIPGTYRLGFTNLDRERHIPNLLITGSIPSWISGTLLRNGPAKFYTPTSWVSNWFDGLAMIHAFSIDKGTVSYTNKFLRSSDYEQVKKTGKMNYAGFIQDPCGSRFKNIITAFFPQPCSPRLPNANVNIAHYTKKFIALTEIPVPIEFDPVTLATIGAYEYADQLPKKDIHDTAHPHYDPIKKEHLGYFTKFGRTSMLNLFKIVDGSTTRSIIFSLPVKEPSYMHSFAITKNFAILTALPLVVNPSDLLKGKGFIESFVWKPERGTDLIVINRHTGVLVGQFKTVPFFAFHTVNAYEEKNSIHLDIVTYPNSAGLAQASFDSLLAPDDQKKEYSQTVEPDAEIRESGQLQRFTIDIAKNTVTYRLLAEKFIELPRINYEKYNGRDYSYVYAFAQDTADEHAYVANALVKINVKTGNTLSWHEDACYPGEPVFIAHPAAKTEDEGVVASIVLNAKTGTSFLLVLDAKTFTEIARAQVPHHIPFGIHGIFAPRDIILA